eukprot:m51a1_g11902 hypothetical protein (860) ;mRNA; r:619921-622662
MFAVDLSQCCWTLRRQQSGAPAYPAVVPGDVLSDLERAGALTDPLASDAEPRVLSDVLRGAPWLYETTVDLPRDILSETRLALVFDGLDTLCTVRLNGVAVGASCNAHRRHAFAVPPGAAREGPNALSLEFASAWDHCQRAASERPGGSSPLAAWEYAPHIGPAHRQLLRKPACHFGWDWGPALPSCGVSGPARLVAHSAPLVASVTPLQLWSGDDCGELTVSVRVRVECGTPGLAFDAEASLLSASASVRGVCAGGAPGDETLVELPLKVGRVAAEDLWWPRGYGAQPLHRLRVVLRQQGSQAAFYEREMRVGLRRIELDTADGGFAFVVNGQRVYAKGADWVPVDLLRGRVTEQRTRELVEWCVHANFNCVRVWGGGEYESEAFYDACDERGLLVWQDLGFGCACYPADSAFLAEVEAEVRWQARRLAGRTCLALWCGNNEIEEGMPFGCPPSPLHKSEYLRLFRDTIPPVLMREDGTRSFWRSSPSSSSKYESDFDEKAGDQSQGDCHYWGVWHGSLDISRYRTLDPRFISEFGFQSLPPLDSIEKALGLSEHSAVHEQGLKSAELLFRQRSGNGNDKLCRAVSLYFPPALQGPRKLESEVFLTQCLQAFAIGPALDHMRRLQPHCMGSLFWQLNDVWVAPSWSALAYPARPKPVHYAARRAYAPVAISIAPDEDGGLTVWAVSELGCECPGRLKARVLHWAGGVPVVTRAIDVVVAPRASVRLMDLDMPPDEDPRAVLFHATFRPDDGSVDPSETFFAPASFKSAAATLNGARPTARVVSVSEDGAEVCVSAAGGVCPFVWLDDAGQGGRFSDNAFALVPARKPKRVRYTPAPGSAAGKPRVTCACLWDLCETLH